MTKQVDNKQKITLRVTPYQNQVLEELKNALHVPMSIIIRSIIGDFITRNEDILEAIVTGEKQIDIENII